MIFLKNIITVILVAGIFALHPGLNKGSTPITSLQHFVYGNSLKIFTNNTIDKNLLAIKWICDTQEDPCNELMIFNNGIHINKIPSAKGNQKLVVFYNNEMIGEIKQNKATKNQAHDYNLYISIENNKLLFKSTVVGPSAHNGTSIAIASL